MTKPTDLIKEAEGLLSLVPKNPWHYREGDDFDHWELWSSDPNTGFQMVQDDSGVPPDKGFIEYILRSRDIIERLLQEIKND